MTWQTENPQDIDLYVMSVKKTDHRDTCKTYWDEKDNCQGLNLDVDNRKGGPQGAETITLTNNAINKDYVYLIAIEEYNFDFNDQKPFLSSGASIIVTNGVKTEYARMEASSISQNTG